MPTTITAASDDLIEVDGDIREEFNDVDFGGGAYVYLSSGHVLYFHLGPETWHAEVLAGDRSQVSITTDERGDDTVLHVGTLDWVVATTTAPAKPR